MIRKLIILTILLVGCATPAKMNRLSLGMTKPEVIKVMGSPDSSSADASGEYLYYLLTSDGGAWYNPYFVRFDDGKVISYGMVPKEGQKVNIDATIKNR